MRELQFGEPAAEYDISAAEATLGYSLPTAYREFLHRIGGVRNSESGLLLYSTFELVERNLTWDVNSYARGYIAIGDDSGGRVILIRNDDPRAAVYLVDAGAMTVEKMKLIEGGWASWEEKSFALPM